MIADDGARLLPLGSVVRPLEPGSAPEFVFDESVPDGT
jgi:hypothetical protein